MTIDKQQLINQPFLVTYSLGPAPDTMGDSSVQNKVESEGIQGANFVSSQVQNPIFNIHTPGKIPFSQCYQKLKIIQRNFWKCVEGET